MKKLHCYIDALSVEIDLKRRNVTWQLGATTHSVVDGTIQGILTLK